jgi:hypothetical protein
MRKASFSVTEGDKSVEITLIDLPADRNELAANVNRWRGQVELPPASPEELEESVEKIPMGEVFADYVELVGPENAEPRKAIYGAVAVHGELAWFFKLVGDAELAKKEKQRYRAFLDSVRFGDSDGAGNGN